MKIAILTLFLVATVLAEDQYEQVDEKFNVSELLENDRLLNSYAKCLLNKGPCTPEVRKVKEKLPEALATRCAKCTDRQKQIGKQLAKAVKGTRPELWKELVAYYDPDGKHVEAFKEYFN